MVAACCVNVNAVHVNQTSCCAPTQAMQIEPHTFLQYVGIPGAVARLAAENELNRRIEQLERFRPLVRLLGVVLLGHLSDLPWAPDLIAQSPVLDTIRLIPAIFAPEVSVVDVAI